MCQGALPYCRAPNEATEYDMFQMVPAKNDTTLCINMLDYHDQAIPGLPFFGGLMDHLMGNEITYYVYTPGQPKPKVMKMLSDLESNMVEKYRKLLFLVHGWTANHDSNVIGQLAKAYQEQRHPAILIGVDWSTMSRRSYVDSRGHVYTVGEMVGDQIQKLMSRIKMYVHIGCVGHSLGAHVCGSVGKSTNRLEYLVGLDPASPLFFKTSDDLLSKTDARYVEVIHTNTAMLGYSDPLGHADIYPFGGDIQPDCMVVSCSHSMAITYFIEAVKNNSIDLVQCPSMTSLEDNTCSADQVTKISGTSIIKKFGIFLNKYKDEDDSFLGRLLHRIEKIKNYFFHKIEQK